MIRVSAPLLIAFAFAATLSGGAVLLAAEAEPDCLNADEVREVVTNRVVIPQIQALRLARSTMGGDAIRASLCRADGGFIYIITMLARDGKLARVRIRGETGEAIPAEKE